jgi:hypothetical protein
MLAAAPDGQEFSDAERKEVMKGDGLFADPLVSLPCWAIAARNSESLSFVDADSSTTALTNATTSAYYLTVSRVAPPTALCTRLY